MKKLIKTLSCMCVLMLVICVSSNLLLYSKPGNARAIDDKRQQVAQIDTSSSENKKMEVEVVLEEPPSEVPNEVDEEDLVVQTVLTPFKNVVISATLDGVLEKLPFESGDMFKKGDVLVKYKCDFESAKVRESEARVRSSNRQLTAFQRLKKLDNVSEVEFVSMSETNKQERALLDQAKARLDMCTIVAPFDGRVQKKMASNYEGTKSGRVLMEISSSDPLQAELLVPSVWLRWINIGTDVNIYVVESDTSYSAEVIRIHGEVDPITQSVRVVAQIGSYEEELLPGMSGTATFQSKVTTNGIGFMGLKIGEF